MSATNAFLYLAPITYGISALARCIIALNDYEDIPGVICIAVFGALFWIAGSALTYDYIQLAAAILYLGSALSRFIDLTQTKKKYPWTLWLSPLQSLFGSFVWISATLTKKTIPWLQYIAACFYIIATIFRIVNDLATAAYLGLIGSFFWIASV
tara:strand:+ start:69 stop:530 length:462 start_codon:yes stop_codon:yes gene_type:complete